MLPLFHFQARSPSVTKLPRIITQENASVSPRFPKRKSFKCNVYKKKGGPLKKARAGRQHRPRLLIVSSELVDLLALDESLFQHFLVAKPQIGDIG